LGMGEQRTFAGVAWSQKGTLTRREPRGAR
jgi:hypothetical protein